MSFLAANSADFSNLSPCLVEQAIAGLLTRSDRGELLPSSVAQACSNRTAITAGFGSQRTDDNSALARVCRYASRLMLGHRFGVFPAPGGAWSSASHSAPLRGLGSSQNKFANDGKKRRANFFRAPPRKQTFGLRSRTHSLGFAQCDPSNSGKFNRRRYDYVPEQSYPHRLCRQ
jgi:hypothetical protein